MKLILCDCGHKSHPVRGKPKSFEYDDKYLKYYQCPGCLKIITVQSNDNLNWKRIDLNKKIVAASFKERKKNGN